MTDPICKYEFIFPGTRQQVAEILEEHVQDEWLGLSDVSNIGADGWPIEWPSEGRWEPRINIKGVPRRIDYLILRWMERQHQETGAVYEYTKDELGISLFLEPSAAQTRITALCYLAECKPELDEALRLLGAPATEAHAQPSVAQHAAQVAEAAAHASPSAAKEPRGMNANTEAKVREAHRLLKAGTKWAVIKETCTYETYMRWCATVTGEEPITKL